jgi:hypothetical protein
MAKKIITASSIVPFGIRGCRNKPLSGQPTKFLQWIASRKDTDLHPWALAAEKVLASRAAGDREAQCEADLQAAADALLIASGNGNLVPRRNRR